MDISNKSTGMKRPREVDTAEEPCLKRHKRESDDFFRDQCVQAARDVGLDTLVLEMLQNIFDQMEEAYQPMSALQLSCVSKELSNNVAKIASVRIYKAAFEALGLAWSLIEDLASNYNVYFDSFSMMHTWKCHEGSECEFEGGALPTHKLSLRHMCCKLLAAYDIESAMAIAAEKCPEYHFAIADTLHRFNTGEQGRVQAKCFEIFESSPMAEADWSLRQICSDDVGFFMPFPALAGGDSPLKAIDFCKGLSSFMCGLNHVAHGYSKYIENNGFDLNEFDEVLAKVLEALSSSEYDGDFIEVFAHMCFAISSQGQAIPPAAASKFLDLIVNEEQLSIGHGRTVLLLLMKHSCDFFQAKGESEELYAVNCSDFLAQTFNKIDIDIESVCLGVELNAWMYLQFPQLNEIVMPVLSNCLDVILKHAAIDGFLDGVYMLRIAQAMSKVNLQAAWNAVSFIQCPIEKIDAILTFEVSDLKVLYDKILATVKMMINSSLYSPSLVEKAIKLFVRIEANEEIDLLCKAIVENTWMLLSPINQKRYLIAIIKGFDSSNDARRYDLTSKLQNEITKEMPVTVIMSEMLKNFIGKKSDVAALLVDQALRAISALEDSHKKAKLLLWLADRCLRD